MKVRVLDTGIIHGGVVQRPGMVFEVPAELGESLLERGLVERARGARPTDEVKQAAEAGELAGKELDEAAAEFGVEGRSSMPADEKREAIAEGDPEPPEPTPKRKPTRRTRSKN